MSADDEQVPLRTFQAPFRRTMCNMATDGLRTRGK